MARSWSQLRVIDRFASLALVLEWAFGLRVLAADVVQWYTQRKGVLCVFPDTNIYWALARRIREGAPYEVTVSWGELPHAALRTPGYPLFLAVCQAAFGDRLLPVRLIQAGLGTLGVWLVYRLVRRVAPGEPEGRPWTTPLIAAALAATDPYIVASSALVLSEALFIPLMTATLWGWAVLWPRDGEPSPRNGLGLALLVGIGSGVAVLVRPSWALFIPLMLLAWMAASGRGSRVAAMRGAMVVALGVVVVMTPWWVRNERVIGRFVPTALWVGASLYDGLNPNATGASDMDPFLNAPDIWPLDETTQDKELRDRALAFVAEHPGKALRLAVVKAGRFWSPWPNADNLKAPGLAWASALVMLPVFLGLAIGIWDRRRDARALILLAGPLVYFCVLHMVFVSSVRYRIPGMVPAMGLVAIGFRRVMNKSS